MIQPQPKKFLGSKVSAGSELAAHRVLPHRTVRQVITQVRSGEDSRSGCWALRPPQEGLHGGAHDQCEIPRSVGHVSCLVISRACTADHHIDHADPNSG
jgi:hypothetical protein